MRTAVIELGSRRCRLLVADLSRGGNVRNMGVEDHRELHTDVVVARAGAVPPQAVLSAANVVAELASLPAADAADRVVVVPTGAAWRRPEVDSEDIVGQLPASWWWPSDELDEVVAQTAVRVAVEDPVVLHVDERHLVLTRVIDGRRETISLPAGPLRFLDGMPPRRADLGKVGQVTAVLADRHPQMLRWVRARPMVVTGLAAGLPFAVRTLLGRWTPDPLLPYRMPLSDLRRVVDQLRSAPTVPTGGDAALWETAAPAAAAVATLCRMFTSPPPELWFDDMTVGHVALLQPHRVPA